MGRRGSTRFGTAVAVAAFGGLLALGLAPLACRPPAPEPSEGAPRLLLLIVADQFRGDYLERFDALWSGGLRRLLDRGAVFEDAHHRHAITHTAPGHASLASGVHPRRHGIIANYWIDPASLQRVYCVDDPAHKVSPVKLLSPTLGDWLKERSPRSRVFSVSGKDRAAILLGGRRADAAFWYDAGDWDEELGGVWTSNGFYPAGEPQWLAEFLAESPVERWFGVAWEPLPVTAERLAAAGVEPFDLGPLEPDFPHALGGLTVGPQGSYYAQLARSPWLDEAQTRLAERLIVEEELGQDGWTDLLALSYSALDYVGHAFGPDSPEVLDLLLRFDRRLEELLDFVDRQIGLEHVVVALSSDHGVMPLPELGRTGGRRLAAADVLCLQQVNRRLAERFGDEPWLLRGPFVNVEVLTRRGVDRGELEAEVAVQLKACPAVRRVWWRDELGSSGEPAAAPFLNAHNPERSPDLYIEFEPYFMPTLTAATHGSARPYDTQVPLILLVPGLAPLRDGDPAATVDLAPTLAALAGLPAPAVDGVDLGPRLRAAGRTP